MCERDLAAVIALIEKRSDRPLPNHSGRWSDDGRVLVFLKF